MEALECQTYDKFDDYYDLFVEKLINLWVDFNVYK